MAIQETQGKPLASTPTGYPNGYNPNSLENLAKGRAKLAEKRRNGELTNPEGYSLRAELKHALNKEKRLAVVNSTIEGAILREPTPFKELWDRVDGKVPGDGVAINFNEIKIVVVEAAPPEQVKE